MALYGEVVDVTQPNPGTIMVWYQIKDDSDDQMIAGGDGSHAFNVYIQDANGDEIVETLVQKRARLRAEYDAYMARRLAQIGRASEHFAQLREQAIGYRYPAA